MPVLTKTYKIQCLQLCGSFSLILNPFLRVYSISAFLKFISTRPQNPKKEGVNQVLRKWTFPTFEFHQLVFKKVTYAGLNSLRHKRCIYFHSFQYETPCTRIAKKAISQCVGNEILSKERQKPDHVISFSQKWAFWAVQAGSTPKNILLKYATFEGGFFILS